MAAPSSPDKISLGETAETPDQSGMLLIRIAGRRGPLNAQAKGWTPESRHRTILVDGIPQPHGGRVLRWRGQ